QNPEKQRENLSDSRLGGLVRKNTDLPRSLLGGFVVSGVFSDELDDVFHPRPWSKNLCDSSFLQPRNIFVGYYAATEYDHVVEAFVASELYTTRKQCHVCAGQDR